MFLNDGLANANTRTSLRSTLVGVAMGAIALFHHVADLHDLLTAGFYGSQKLSTVLPYWVAINSAWSRLTLVSIEVLPERREPLGRDFRIGRDSVKS